jgi:hypothetical protein
MESKIKTRLREFINDDECYQKYKKNKSKKLNEYEEYFVRHCKDIEESLKYIEELENFALWVGRMFDKKNIDKNN